MMDGYSITEAASVLGVPTERVWELLARGVLAGAPEGETGMRVFLQPRQAPTPVTAASTDEPDSSRSNGPDRELSPFRELLTEFRNLTERYGQALLALGESRGEVASLRSRVDLLEARIDFRLPMGNPAPPWPAQPPPVTDPAGEAEDEEAHRRRRRGARRATESFAEALARAEDPSPADLPGGTDAGAALAVEAATEDADRSLPRDVLPAEPVLVAEEDAGAVERADEGEPPIAAVPETVAPEPVPDEPEPIVDEPEPLDLEPAVVLDQVEAVAFEPTETEFEDLQLAHAGAWGIPADLADEPADPELVDDGFTADAGPAPGEPEWSVEAEPQESLDIAPDEEPDEAPELVIEVEPLPDLPEGEPSTEPAIRLEPEEARPALVAEQSAVEPEPEAADFDAERYTSIIDQPDWFAAEADDWSTGTTSGEATGESEETEGPTAIEPRFQEPDAPEADAPEPEATQPELRESGADEMEVAGGGLVASTGPESPSEGELPGSRELDEALEAYGDLGTGTTAARELDDEWPPATPGGSPAASSAQGSSAYVSPPSYRSTMPSSAGTRAYRRLRRIFPT
jgi:hypothetical protein